MLLRRLLTALALLLASAATAHADMLLGSGLIWQSSSPAGQACDLIAGGCPSAHSMTQKLVAAYSGPAFELVNPKPAWTGTASISGTTLTVATTASGAMANGLALSGAGSGFVPAVLPITYTSLCSGSTCTVSQSQTAVSVTAAYAVLDVGFSGNAWNESTWRPFCYGVDCLVLKIFNQGSAGATDDVIASEVNGGAARSLNCTASIIVCAPLFVIDPATDTPLAFTVASEMGLFADVYSGHSSAGMPAAGANASVMLDGLNIYGSNCCGGIYGLTENNPALIVSGGMFSIGLVTGTGSGGVVNCATATIVCFLADDESGGDPAGWQAYDSGSLQRGVWEIQYTQSTNTSSGLYNGTQLYAVSPPDQDATKRQTWLRIGAGGDRSWIPSAFADGLITSDVANHSAAYNALSSFYTGRSPAACPGPLDLGWYMPSSAFGGAGSGLAASPATVGNGLGGWGLRPLSLWYTGPIVTVQNSAGAGSIQTFSGIGCDIDPAINTFCTSGCLVNTLFNQAWALGVVTNSNIRQTANDMTATGTARPSLTLSSLNGQPTMHFSGAQQLCTTTTPLFNIRGTYAADLAIVARRTGAFTTRQQVLHTNNSAEVGFAAAANSANFQYGTTANFNVSGATDGQWHVLDTQSIGATGGNAYIDGVATAESFITNGGISSQYCIGTTMTGDLAEAVMLYDATFNNAAVNYAPSIYSKEAAFYGAFPQ